MKNLILVIAILLFQFSVIAQEEWNGDVEGQLTTEVKVGIGTADPQAGLHISGEGSSGMLTIERTNGNPSLDFKDGNVENVRMYYDQGNGGLVLQSEATNRPFILKNSTGNVGIGTTDPQTGLHISGEGSSGMLTIERTNGNPSLDFTDGNVENVRMYYDQENGGLVLQSEATNRPFILENSTGNVGIGTTNTFGYKLAVNGVIGSKEVKVENSSQWPDFVFEDDYSLRTLEEVEGYIVEHKHLPEVPSEAEVMEDGINLGEMDAKLLQKIEELTLYLIAQNKENQEQRQLIEELQKEVDLLRDQIKE